MRDESWTESEDFHVLFGSWRDDQDLAEALDRTVRAIRRRRDYLRHPSDRTHESRDRYLKAGGANPPRGNAAWSKVEKDAIMDEDRPSDSALAVELGRSVTSIQQERTRLRRRLQRFGYY
jgi:hypothetical protein